VAAPRQGARCTRSALRRLPSTSAAELSPEQLRRYRIAGTPDGVRSPHCDGIWRGGMAGLQRRTSTGPARLPAEELLQWLAAGRRRAGRPDDVARAARRAGDSGGRPVAAGRPPACCAATAARRGRDRCWREPVHLVNTDPPYNVKVEPRSHNAIRRRPVVVRGRPAPESQRDAPAGEAKAAGKKAARQDRPLAKRLRRRRRVRRLLRAWFGNLARVLLPGRGFYIWVATPTSGKLPAGTGRVRPVLLAGHHLDKQHPVLTARTTWGRTSVLLRLAGRAAHQFFRPEQRHRPVEHQEGQPADMVHLTEKPVRVGRRALAYSSRRGENVLDLFGGSGSTLMLPKQAGGGPS